MNHDNTPPNPATGELSLADLDSVRGGMPPVDGGEGGELDLNQLQAWLKFRRDPPASPTDGPVRGEPKVLPGQQTPPIVIIPTA